MKSQGTSRLNTTITDNLQVGVCFNEGYAHLSSYLPNTYYVFDPSNGKLLKYNFNNPASIQNSTSCTVQLKQLGKVCLTKDGMISIVPEESCFNEEPELLNNVFSGGPAVSAFYLFDNANNVIYFPKSVVEDGKPVPYVRVDVEKAWGHPPKNSNLSNVTCKF